jgi:hypothetical protein
MLGQRVKQAWRAVYDDIKLMNYRLSSNKKLNHLLLEHGDAGADKLW